MKRIFYFTGHRFTVMHWKGKNFAGACSFEPDSAGLDKFEQYLQQSACMATKLLIDVIEEDFRQETIPHVYGKDRKAVVGRILDRYYRASRQFTYHRVIGREKTGRKDDRVLLGAITDPGLLSPWLDVIERTETPLSGIWTLPLISEKLLGLLDAKKGPVLLVSQQVNSTLRQTFFRNGKMISSRQSVINQDASNITNIGKFAHPEISRTTTFLRNQRLIGEQEELQVIMLCSEVQSDSLHNAFEAGGSWAFRLHRIEDIHKKLGLKNIESRFADAIYAWLCMSELFTTGHYGKHDDFRRYYYALASASLYAVSVIVLLIAAVITEDNISSAIESNRSVELLRQQEAGYKKVYSEKFSTYEAVFQNAKSMNAAVDLVNTIEQHATVSPLDLYIELSKIMSRPQFRDVEINRIQWQLEQHSETAGNTAAQSKPDIASPDPMHHVAVVSGKIPVDSSDYGRSVAQVNNIVLALLKHERIETVEALEMPVEVRSDKRFTAQSGVIDADAGKQDRRGVFSIRIVMKGVSHV